MNGVNTNAVIDMLTDIKTNIDKKEKEISKCSEIIAAHAQAAAIYNEFSEKVNEHKKEKKELSRTFETVLNFHNRISDKPYEEENLFNQRDDNE